MIFRSLARRLKSLYPHLRMVFVGSCRDADAAEDCAGLPLRNLLWKPFTPESLARKVREALQKTGDVQPLAAVD